MPIIRKLKKRIYKKPELTPAEKLGRDISKLMLISAIIEKDAELFLTKPYMPRERYIEKEAYALRLDSVLEIMDDTLCDINWLTDSGSNLLIDDELKELLENLLEEVEERAVKKAKAE